MEGTIIKETKIYTFGEMLVGLDTENLEGTLEEDIRRKFGEIAEIIVQQYKEKDRTPVKSLVFEHAIGEILNAQMCVSKLLKSK